MTAFHSALYALIDAYVEKGGDANDEAVRAVRGILNQVPDDLGNVVELGRGAMTPEAVAQRVNHAASVGAIKHLTTIATFNDLTTHVMADTRESTVWTYHAFILQEHVLRGIRSGPTDQQ